MTWEYTGDPTTSAKDAVRFLVGDTVETDPLLQDEEIDYLIAEYGSPSLAAANACQALSAKFARQVSKAVGDLRIDLSDKAKAFQAQAERLFLTSTGSTTPVPAIAPYAGGLSWDEKESDDLDVDLVQTSTYIGIHDSDESDRSRRRRRSEPDYGTLGS